MVPIPVWQTPDNHICLSFYALSFYAFTLSFCACSLLHPLLRTLEFRAWHPKFPPPVNIGQLRKFTQFCRFS